jgi:hypothetical protein
MRLAIPELIPRSLQLGVFAFVVGLFTASFARADFMLIPLGLNSGDQFRVVFVSSTRRNALSSAISDHDQFITNAAVAAGLDTYFGTPSPGKSWAPPLRCLRSPASR